MIEFEVKSKKQTIGSKKGQTPCLSAIRPRVCPYTQKK